MPGFSWLLRMIGGLLLAGDCRSGLLFRGFYLSKENYTDNEVIWIPESLRVEYILACKVWARPNPFQPQKKISDFSPYLHHPRIRDPHH